MKNNKALVKCDRCNGKGFEDVEYSFRVENGFVKQDAIEKCNMCEGKGIVEITKEMGNK